MVNLIEIEHLEARFIREFGIKNLSYIIDLETWARDGIYDMRIPNFYQVKDIELKVTNGKAPIRCATDMLVAAYYYPYQDSEFRVSNSFELIIRNDNSFGSGGLQCLGNMYATVNSGNIHVSNNDGYIRLFYKDVPTDCNGKTLIPNNPKVIKALMYYFIYRMSLSGYKHPVIDFKTALAFWEKEYPAAGNDASWFTEMELQAFTEMWTNPLLGDLHRNNYIH
jgi:hypothetical protein